MSHTLSTEVEKLARGYVDGQRFTSANDVLLFSLQVLGEFEKRYNEQFGKTLEDAFDKLKHGEGLVLENSEELSTVFDDIMQAGRARYDATRHG